MTDLCSRSLKAQMKYAGKIGAKKTLILGEEELRTGSFLLKDMATGEQLSVTEQTLAQSL